MPFVLALEGPTPNYHFGLFTITKAWICTVATVASQEISRDLEQPDLWKRMCNLDGDSERAKLE
jgi:hypothetical protein